MGPIPDVYFKNEKLEEKVQNLIAEVHNYKLAADKAKYPKIPILLLSLEISPKNFAKNEISTKCITPASNKKKKSFFMTSKNFVESTAISKNPTVNSATNTKPS